jgi:hypothetical protein
MKPTLLSQSVRLALAGAALAASMGAAVAQDSEDGCLDLQGTPPGLYVTVQQNEVYLIKDGSMVELKPGESGFASESDLACLKVPPEALDWPCNTSEAMARQMAPTYSAEELPAVGGVQEVVQRYFKENQAISPPIQWLNGETHGTFPAFELEELDSSTYWYIPGSEDPFKSPKRPKTLIVSLFWATGQAVVDKNTLTPLEIQYPNGDIPVVFVFNRDNEVPVSFFGPKPTLQQITRAYLERGIELAPVPLWYAGDHHFEVSLKEMERAFELPALDDIPPERQQAIRKELETYGFFHKPISIVMMEETGNMVIDQPDVVRVAATMGLTAFPVVMFYYNSSSHLAGCGIPLPVTSVVGGATSEGEMAGIIIPPQIAIPPQLPDPERNPSDS